MKLIIALLAVTAAAAAGSAAAEPPPPSVTCAAGGTTSFAHPPHGTTNVLFVYSSPTGGTVASFQWVGKSKRDATPDQVSPGDVVTATFNDSLTQLDSVTVTCS